MIQKKRGSDVDLLNADANYELTESELATICGGVGGFPNLPDWLTAAQTPDKSAKNSADKDNGFANFNGFDTISKLTNSLLGQML